MKLTSSWAVAALALLASPFSLSAVSLSDKGIGVGVPGAGSYVFKYPQLLDGAQKPKGKLIECAASGNSAKLKYDNGTQAQVTVSGADVSIQFSNVAEGVKTFKVASDLGFGFMGAQYKTDTQEFRPFPEQQPDKAHLVQAKINSLTFSFPTGSSLQIGFPSFSFVQLTDGREWKWKNFMLSVFVPVNKDAASKFRFSTEGSGETAAAKPLMDQFGQYTPKDWPQKIKSVDDLKADIKEDEAYYASFDPPQFDKYGGLVGSKEKFGLTQTGFFHVEKKGDRWYLVNPEGNWFFHLGVGSFQPYCNSTYVQGREKIYEWLPPIDGEFNSAYGQDGGGKKDGQFNFFLANRIRKYGKPYDPKEFTAQMIERVRKFGFNSTASAGPGDASARKEANFPHVSGLPLLSWKGVPMMAREVWDPFDEKTREIVDKNMSALANSANNPLLIGYFIANEPLYEDVPKLVAAYNEKKASKLRLVQMLEEKYKTIDAFNTAWETKFSSFDEVKKQGLPMKSKAAAEDMAAFKRIFLEEVFKFTHDTLRKYDPNHMLLGCRLQAGTINDEDLCRIGAKYCDIWSFNYYTYGLDETFLKKIYGWTGKPMIFSEFYWNSFEDSGVSGGVKDVTSQQERGLAYRNYVEHAASLPFVVGVEWFMLIDASQTGVGFAKYNGENPNSGLFSVADRPWKPMIAEMIKTNYDIYKVGAGERPRWVYDNPKFIGGKTRQNSVVASKVSTPIKPDGQTGDWPGMPSERVGTDRLIQGKEAANYEGAFKLAWDDQNLYVLADIQDTTPAKNAKQAGELWNGDGIELFIGSEELGTGGKLLFTDRQILIGATPEEAKIHYLNAPEQYGGNLAVVPKSDGAGYVMEVAIPWSALSVKPSLNKELLFDIALDDSLDGARRDKQLMWNGTTRNSGDRTNWGRVRLIGQ